LPVFAGVTFHGPGDEADWNGFRDCCWPNEEPPPRALLSVSSRLLLVPKVEVVEVLKLAAEPVGEGAWLNDDWLDPNPEELFPRPSKSPVADDVAHQLVYGCRVSDDRDLRGSARP